MGTVGKPLPNLDVRIEADGEVLVRGPNVMKGYYKNDEATMREFVDGWFRTGDIGEVDGEGYLKIIDRKKNLIVLSTGKNVAPQPIECAINQSAYIEQTVIIGHGRKYVTALVVPSYEMLEPWAKAKSLAYASKKDIIFNPEVQHLLKNEVNKLIEPYAPYEKPKKVILLGTEWTIEGGEITPTLKVKMREVEKRYRPEIEMVYEEFGEDIDLKEMKRLNDHAVCLDISDK